MDITQRVNSKILVPFLESAERERHDIALKKMLEGDVLAKAVQKLALEDAIFHTNKLDVIRKALLERAKTREVKGALKHVLQKAAVVGEVTKDKKFLPVNVDECDPRDVATLRQAGLIK